MSKQTRKIIGIIAIALAGIFVFIAISFAGELQEAKADETKCFSKYSEAQNVFVEVREMSQTYGGFEEWLERARSTRDYCLNDYVHAQNIAELLTIRTIIFVALAVFCAIAGTVSLILYKKNDISQSQDTGGSLVNTKIVKG